MKLAKCVSRYCVDKEEKFRLADHDPGDTGGLDIDKKEAKDLLAEGINRLSDLQERLYAQDRWALLAIFQAMDAAGKDSAIAHVMSGINPQGCKVHSFKRPSNEEYDHDFLWRSFKRLPERARIGIFLERLDTPSKHWKFEIGDLAERKLWHKHMFAYEDMIHNTSTPDAPWYVVPADNKWFSRIVVAAAMVEALESLDLKFPSVRGAALRGLKNARQTLQAESGK